ncbi:MAG: hypothetical protein M1820_007445 [Bogoriella megaspora]|nr:MAG: hypothetical protein M1820_007445 [Bogoriella megaspora]
MDRSLDEIIHDRSTVTEICLPENDIDASEWIHDKYNEDDEDRELEGTRIKVENLHYDITTDDLQDLFSTKGQLDDVNLLFDRFHRSRGIAFITYRNTSDAIDAIQDFNNANARGQPIRVTEMTSDHADYGHKSINPPGKPSRSLFDRITDRADTPPQSRRRRGVRSASPVRRHNVTKPAPEGIDRYVPGQRRSSPRRRGAPRGAGGGRMAGARRDARARNGEERTSEGRALAQGRPKKTADELDAEMDDYWGDETADDRGLSTQAESIAQPSVQIGGGNGVEEMTGDNDIDMDI